MATKKYGEGYVPANELASDRPSVQITMRFDRDVLDRLNEMAVSHGITRSAYVKEAIALKMAADRKLSK